MDNGINPESQIDFPTSPAAADMVDDTEGHRLTARRFVGNDTVATDDVEDTEGHRYARGYMFEDQEDTEGHRFRR